VASAALEFAISRTQQERWIGQCPNGIRPR
jgi:hypothetical protein